MNRITKNILSSWPLIFYINGIANCFISIYKLAMHTTPDMYINGMLNGILGILFVMFAFIVDIYGTSNALPSK